PTKGVFNLELARALAQAQQLRVISPVPWTDAWRARRRNARHGRECVQAIDGIAVHYPRFYYPPKVLRRFYGWFLWQSVRGTLQRLLQSSVPDAVLGYWAHPDGEVAVRIARMIGVPAIVMVGGSDVLLLAREKGRRRCIENVL